MTSKIVFVTPPNYTGNLGGTEGANAICQTLAEAAGLPGNYKAWLSTSNPGDNPAQSFTQSTLPYVTPDSNLTEVAANWSSLISGNLINPIEFYANGGHSYFPSFTWTNTQTNGQPTSTTNLPYTDCTDWNALDGNGEYGVLGSQNYEWTYTSATLPCDTGNHSLLCFQQ